MLGEGVQDKMTSESLKLDMTKPENRYALIVSHLATREGPLTGMDNDYFQKVKYEAYAHWLKGEFSSGRIAGQIRIATPEMTMPALPLLIRAEREKQGETK